LSIPKLGLAECGWGGGDCVGEKVGGNISSDCVIRQGVKFGALFYGKITTTKGNSLFAHPAFNVSFLDLHNGKSNLP